MLYWAFVFLLVAVLAAGLAFGVTGFALTVAAKALCVVFLGLFVVAIVPVLVRTQGVGRA